MNTGDMEAKELLDHGQWMPWLKEHCDLPQRTANLYMRLAKNREVIEAHVDAPAMTINAATRLLAPAKNEEEELEDLRANC
jgi:hypothetical protein